MVRTIAFFSGAGAGGAHEKPLYFAPFIALVAQLDRVLVSEAYGHSGVVG
jgi:hypothetical protein